MDLQTFVTGTLDQIFSGIKDANEKRNNNLFKLQMNSGENKSTIEFDVALTISQENAQGGGGTLKVWGIGIGGNVENTSSTESISRVRFAVQVDKDGSEKEVGFRNQTGERIDMEYKKAINDYSSA